MVPILAAIMKAKLPTPNFAEDGRGKRSRGVWKSVYFHTPDRNCWPRNKYGTIKKEWKARRKKKFLQLVRG
jgi:hypothetical protein